MASKSVVDFSGGPVAFELSKSIPNLVALVVQAFIDQM